MPILHNTRYPYIFVYKYIRICFHLIVFKNPLFVFLLLRRVCRYTFLKTNSNARYIIYYNTFTHIIYIYIYTLTVSRGCLYTYAARIVSLTIYNIYIRYYCINNEYPARYIFTRFNTSDSPEQYIIRIMYSIHINILYYVG